MGLRSTYLIAEAARRLKDNLGAMPTSEQRYITAVARKVLLDGPYFYNGRYINPIGKSIGAGVYSITHKELK